jgi:hypothetical protein
MAESGTISRVPRWLLNAMFGHTMVVSQAASKLNQDCIEAAHLGCPERVIIIAACTSFRVLERKRMTFV